MALDEPEQRSLAAALSLGGVRGVAPCVVFGGTTVVKDVGAPAYLGSRDVVSVAFVEVDAARAQPPDYLRDFATADSFDYLWFTPRHARPDPCAALLKR